MKQRLVAVILFILLLIAALFFFRGNGGNPPASSGAKIPAAEQRRYGTLLTAVRRLPKQERPTLCREAELPVFSCKTDDGKRISYCISDQTENPYILFRFGTRMAKGKSPEYAEIVGSVSKEKSEIVYPEASASSFKKFKYLVEANVADETGVTRDSARVVLNRDGKAYEMYYRWTGNDQFEFSELRIYNSTRRSFDSLHSIQDCTEDVVGSLKLFELFLDATPQG